MTNLVRSLREADVSMKTFSGEVVLVNHAAADRIEQLEAAIMEISRINNRRDRFSSEIDAVIYKALESGND